MSYRILIPDSQIRRNYEAWDSRDMETELKVIQTRTIIAVFEKYLHKSEKLIEAGCGLGGWVKYFSEKGYEITGVEYDNRIVMHSKNSCPGIKIECQDVSRLSFSDSTFDAYISLGVLEHFEEGPQKALLEAKRVVKHNGLMFISVPLLTPMRFLFAHPLRELYFLFRRLKGAENHFGEYRYTKKEILAILNESGIEPIYVGVDDFCENDRIHHMGLYADYPFLRARKGEIWELNSPGRILLIVLRLFSPWLFCSGIIVVARNMK